MAITADEDPVAIPLSIYTEAKAWIAHQEAYEAEHRKPAPLTAAQRTALQALRLPAAAPPPPPAVIASPVVLPTGPPPNYVGLLMYHQKHQRTTVDFEEGTAGTLPGPVIARICRVTIADSLAHESGHIERFPAKGYGLNADGSELRFTSKKAAKHFAAKCAVEWLVTQRLMALPPSLSSAVAASLPSSQPLENTFPGSATTGLKRATQGSNNTLLPPPKRQTMAAIPLAGETGIATDGPPATEQITKLCAELNITAPRYAVIECALNPNTYDGRATFEHWGDHELMALSDASAVHHVVGKDNAKKAVAGKVLAKLREIEAAREAQWQLLKAKAG